MAPSQLLIKNLLTNNLAVTAFLGRGQQIQLNLPVGKAVDVSGVASIAELNRSLDINHLVAVGAISVTPVPSGVAGTAGATSSTIANGFSYSTTGDLPGMPGIPDSVGRENAMLLHFTFAAGSSGAADQIIYNANSPKMRLLDTTFVCTTNVGGSTLTMRTATGGSGTAISDALSTATTGTKRNATTAASTSLAAGSSLVARLSDGGVAGELLLLVDIS